MDASDKLRRDNSKAQWVYLKNNVLTPQNIVPDCTSTLASVNLTTGSKIQYKTYDQKYTISLGRKSCDCTTSCQCS